MVTKNWDASLYDQKHAFVFGHGKNLVELLEPHPGEVILDLGCGTGHLTHDIAQTGAQVTGIDSSANMVQMARTSYPDLEFHVADARTFTFPHQFDAIFSNATLHWIPEAEQVVTQIAQALKPGGRFIAEFGGWGNVAGIIATTRQAIKNAGYEDIEPGWNFPSIGTYASLLEKHNLSVHSAALFERPTRLEGEQGFQNWLQMFAVEQLFHKVPEQARAQIIQQTAELARPSMYRDNVWIADYVRLRIVASKNLLQ